MDIQEHHEGAPGDTIIIRSTELKEVNSHTRTDYQSMHMSDEPVQQSESNARVIKEKLELASAETEGGEGGTHSGTYTSINVCP